MTLKEYQEKAKVTDIRDNSIKMICNGFGLIGEQEELIESVQKFDKESTEIDKEYGDILWYASSICSYFDTSLESVIKGHLEQVDLNKPIAEVFKKVYRDKQGKFDEKDIAFILTYIYEIFEDIDIEKIEHYAELNIEKLYSRKERGVISGNGNNR